MLPEKLVYVKFMSKFIISKNNISSIFKIANDQFNAYPMILNISDVDGIDYQAIDFCKCNEIVLYNKRIAILFNSSNISEKYAHLISRMNTGCSELKPFSHYQSAVLWAVS
jgi:hypothetical protein